VTAGIAITGMHCQSCVALISEIVAEQPGVANVDVDLETAHASVAYDAGIIGLDDLCVVVTGIGYGASPSPESSSGA
jgi:copper chaperone CopZ